MKKRVLIILLTVCIFLTGCVIHQPATEPSATWTDPSASETQPKPVEMDIAGNDISRYTILWAPSEYASYRKLYKKYLPGMDFNEETAYRLQSLIMELTGVELEVVDATGREIGNYDILVGNVKHADTGLKEDDYQIFVTGSQLEILGGTYGTTWHALDDLEKTFREHASQGKISIPKNFNHSGTYHLLRIGMVGDSITQGNGSNTEERGCLSYPMQVGRILWKECLVYNYGNAGKTMCNHWSNAYIKCSTYQEALEGAAQLDVMTIMLGTNDAKSVMDVDMGYTEKFDQQYYDSCKELMDSFSAKNSDLKYYLFNAPEYFGTNARKEGLPYVHAVQLKTVDRLKADGFDVTHVDVYEMTRRMRNTFPDTVHPNSQGHLILAEKLAEYLRTDLKLG